jgi:hypothetical protein
MAIPEISDLDIRAAAFRSTRSSAVHIGELGGYFSVAHGKNVNAAQMPWLASTHLAINPSHDGLIAAPC